MNFFKPTTTAPSPEWRATTSTPPGMTEEEVEALLKKQYDGYHFGRRMTDIYNPFSILNACKSCYIDDYWFSSGTPSYLVRLLNHSQENMNELTNRYYTTLVFLKK